MTYNVLMGTLNPTESRNSPQRFFPALSGMISGK